MKTVYNKSIQAYNLVNGNKVLVSYIKILGSLLFLIILAYQLKDKFSSLDHLFLPNILKLLSISLIFIPLLYLNYWLETKKWQVGLGSHISTTKAYRTILVGSAVSIFLPNRTGEFLGRALAVPKELKLKAVYSSLVGRLSQLVVTLFLGSIFLFTHNPLLELNNQKINFVWLSFIAFLISIILTLVLFNSEKMLNIGFLKKISFVQKTINKLTFVNTQQTWKILGLSLLRFSVYVVQYILLIYLFQNKSINMITTLMGICSLFLLLAIIPSNFFTDLGVRGLLVLWIFQNYLEYEPTGLVLSSTFLWLLNVALPAIIGWVLLIKKPKLTQ